MTTTTGIPPNYLPAVGNEDQPLRFARILAHHWHAKQVRKYTGEPYIHHPYAVAGLVASVPHDNNMLAAAWMHDVVEDCGVDLALIYELFGEDTAHLVTKLTDISKPQDGNRAFRKQMDREWLATGSARVKTIKLADLISNSESIVRHDPNFAIRYLREKRLLLEVLKEGDSTLWAQADKICRDAGY